MSQVRTNKTRRDATVDEVAPKPGERTQHAKSVKADSDDLMAELDALVAEADAEEKAAFKEKLRSIAMGPRHCCGACIECPRGFRS